MLFSKAGPRGSVLVDSGSWVLIFIIKGKWDSRVKNFVISAVITLSLKTEW